MVNWNLCESASRTKRQLYTGAAGSPLVRSARSHVWNHPRGDPGQYDCRSFTCCSFPVCQQPCRRNACRVGCIPWCHPSPLCANRPVFFCENQRLFDLLLSDSVDRWCVVRQSDKSSVAEPSRGSSAIAEAIQRWRFRHHRVLHDCNCLRWSLLQCSSLHENFFRLSLA